MTAPKPKRGGTETVVLDIKLRPDEIAKKKMQALDMNQELQQIRHQRSRMIRDFNRQIRVRQSEIDNLCNCVELGTEQRQVKADTIVDYKAGTISFYFEGEHYSTVSYEDFRKAKQAANQDDDEDQIPLL